jgi:hypothetical protein
MIKLKNKSIDGLISVIDIKKGVFGELVDVFAMLALFL